MRLVVRDQFSDYVKGSIIEDEEIIKKILESENKSKVVKIEVEEG